MALATAFMLLTLGIQNAAHAADTSPALSARQWEIIRTVQSVDGYVDQQLHREFWALMPAMVRNSSEAHQMLEDLLTETGEARQDFIEQSWISARESLKARRIVRTQGYLNAKAAVTTASQNAAYQAKVRESIAAAEKLLTAAAEGTSIEIPGGRAFINVDLIERVLSGIQASEFRLGKLLTPSWNDAVSEYRYPEAHVALLATSPFVSERQLIKNAEGREVEMVMLSQRADHSTFLAVTFSGSGGRFADPAKSVTSIAKAAIEGAGASGRPPASFTWRGYHSAVASGTGRSSEGDHFVSVRAVAVPELGGVLQFMVVSDLSAAEAFSKRASLEDATIITP